MPARLIRGARIVLLLIALSLGLLCFIKGNQSARYFSTPMQLTGTVTASSYADPIPLARGNPRAGEVTMPVATRLDVQLKEHPGLLFQVWLHEDPTKHPPLPAAGSTVTLILPRRWKELEVDKRVLVFGMEENDKVVVDPKKYSYAAEYRTAFLSVGAGIGAFIAVVAALSLHTDPPAEPPEDAEDERRDEPQA